MSEVNIVVSVSRILKNESARRLVELSSDMDIAFLPSNTVSRMTSVALPAFTHTNFQLK